MNDLNNYPDLTKEELITLCVRGDRNAQNILYQRFAASMEKLCLRYTSNGEGAREIITEGFLKVFSKLGKFEYHGSMCGIKAGSAGSTASLNNIFLESRSKTVEATFRNFSSLAIKK